MRIARALAIKTTLPLCVAGVLLSGSAIAVQSVVTSVNSVPVASAGAHGAHLAMVYDGTHSKMVYD
jgi:hypothetical protein